MSQRVWTAWWVWREGDAWMGCTHDHYDPKGNEKAARCLPPSGAVVRARLDTRIIYPGPGEHGRNETVWVKKEGTWSDDDRAPYIPLMEPPRRVERPAAPLCHCGNPITVPMNGGGGRCSTHRSEALDHNARSR